MIRNDTTNFWRRGVIGGLVGTSLATIIIIPIFYADRFQRSIAFHLFLLLVCIPFTTIAALLIGKIIWWIQEKSERNFGTLLRIAIGMLLGSIAGCIVGMLDYYLNVDTIYKTYSGTTYLMNNIEFFGGYGLILGAAAGGAIGDRFRIEAIEPASIE